MRNTHLVVVGKYIQDCFEQKRKFLDFDRVSMHRGQLVLQNIT